MFARKSRYRGRKWKANKVSWKQWWRKEKNWKVKNYDGWRRKGENTVKRKIGKRKRRLINKFEKTNGKYTGFLLDDCFFHCIGYYVLYVKKIKNEADMYQNRSPSLSRLNWSPMIQAKVGPISASGSRCSAMPPTHRSTLAEADLSEEELPRRARLSKVPGCP